MRASGRAASGALVGAVLLLAGCSSDGDDQPVTLPSTTTSTASAEPTSPPSITTPPAKPTPATTLVLPDLHVESADIFVGDFFAALNSATATGDFSSLDAMYLPQCSGCTEYRAELQAWLSNDQSVEGGMWTVLQQNSEEVLNGSRILFRVLAYREDAAIVDSAGTVLQEVPGTSVLLGTGGLVSAEPWLVEDMSLSSADDE